MSLARVIPAEAFAEPGDAPSFPDGRTEVEAFVHPGSTDEVAAVLGWASRERVPVVPVGFGLHLPRFVRPERCVVLALDRLAAIERYEPADLTFTAGAGTPLAVLAEELARHGQWLPFDPPDVDARSLGGLVASGESGPLAAGYGALRNHVLGATAVFGDGRVVRLGGRVVKNVAGFDLLRPLVGSHGSLAVLTSLTLRVFPLPEVDRVFVMHGPDAAALTRAARAAATAPVLPASAAVVAGLPEADRAAGPGDGPSGALLVIRLHGTPRAVAADRRKLEEALGSPLEEASPQASAQLLATVRDLPAGPDGVGVVSALPARLESVLAALVDLRDPGGPALVADALKGRVRFSFGPGQLADLGSLCRAVEGLGGSLGVERLPDPGATLAPGSVTAPSDGERALAARVRAVFDPHGVLAFADGAPATAEAAR